MSTINWILGVVLNVALIGWIIYAVRVVKAHGKTGLLTIRLHMILISCALVGFYFIDPLWFSNAIYKGMYLHVLESLFVALALVPMWIAWGMFKGKERKATASSYGLLAIGVAYGGVFVTDALSQWQTAEHYRFERRSALVVTDADTIRYTPLYVAWNEMVQRLNEAAFTVIASETDPVEWDGNLAYVAPLTPDGLINTIAESTDGVMVYNDAPGVPDSERVTRIPLKWKAGEGMQYWDNLYRVLARRDPWTVYGEGFYTKLPSQEIVAVVPRIRYHWRLLWKVPYWDGAEIVHANGDIQRMTVKQLQDDTRFEKTRLFPEDLARYIVTSQSFDQGPLSGLYNRSGKIKVPELPMQNQMPYLMEGADNNLYWVTATEPAGKSSALFRMYYIDARTGVRSVFEWNPDQGVLGPERGIERVKSIPGRRWINGKEGDGDFHVLEAIPIVRPLDPERLWWKYTVTTKSLTGVVETAVVDSSGANQEMLQFSDRDSFFNWLQGKSSTQETKTSDERVKDALKRLEDSKQILEGLLKDKTIPTTPRGSSQR